MSEPFLERLSRFTPDASGLDRDTLLFLAGRASAPPRRLWMVIAAVLAVSQAATLILLWPRDEPPPPTHRSLPPPVVVPELPRESQEDGSRLMSLQRRVLDSGTDDLPPTPGSDGLAVPAGPLRGLSSASAPLLN